jgi:hypothetical protein
VIGILDPAQWLSLGIAFGIVAAGFAYYALYLRARPGTCTSSTPRRHGRIRA